VYVGDDIKIKVIGGNLEGPRRRMRKWRRTPSPPRNFSSWPATEIFHQLELVSGPSGRTDEAIPFQWRTDHRGVEGNGSWPSPL